MNMKLPWADRDMTAVVIFALIVVLLMGYAAIGFIQRKKR
jgi:Mg2+ and Co2+ transporter CorA